MYLYIHISLYYVHTYIIRSITSCLLPFACCVFVRYGTVRYAQCIQSMYRVCTEHVQNVQRMYRVCTVCMYVCTVCTVCRYVLSTLYLVPSA